MAIPLSLLSSPLSGGEEGPEAGKKLRKGDKFFL